MKIALKIVTILVILPFMLLGFCGALIFVGLMTGANLANKFGDFLD